MSAGTYLRQSW